MINITDTCAWKYESAQFAGGPYYFTSCGEVLPVDDDVPYRCPNCYKLVVYKGNEDE